MYDLGVAWLVIAPLVLFEAFAIDDALYQLAVTLYSVVQES